MERQTRRVARILQMRKKNKQTEDFPYIVKRVVKSRICFGSAMERQIATAHCTSLNVVSRLARASIREVNTSTGPGYHQVLLQTSAMYNILNRPTSTVGTVLGGRKQPMLAIPITTNMLSPPPGHYAVTNSNLATWQQNVVPFNCHGKEVRKKQQSTPGPGFYKPHTKTNTLAKLHSFGGKTTIFPAVLLNCSPYNVHICAKCRQLPQGDYWSLSAEMKQVGQEEPVFLCRQCYEQEKQDHKLFSRANLFRFQKLRHCKQFHIHDGSEKKLYVWSQRDMKKLNVRECYLAQYFS